MIKPPTPVDQLRELMRLHDLHQHEVATMSGYSKKAVESWMANPNAASARNFSARNLAMIQAALPAFLKGREAANGSRR